MGEKSEEYMTIPGTLLECVGGFQFPGRPPKSLETTYRPVDATLLSLPPPQHFMFSRVDRDRSETMPTTTALT